MRKIVLSAAATLILLGGCGQSASTTPSQAASAVVPTTATTAAPTTTTTEAPTTTTTLPAPPTFVVLCPAPAAMGYFGKPADFTIGWQGQVNTDTMTLDISWGDGKVARYTSLNALNKARTHAYGPGTYQVNALLTDAYGRSSASNCTISWKDTLPETMHNFDCVLRGNQITTYNNGQSQSYPDPSCGR
jgi:hypothetical protein